MSAKRINRVVCASLTAVALVNLTPADASAGGVEPSRTLAVALEAHGGLATWRSYGRLDYRVEDFPLGDNAPMHYRHTSDLRSRRHQMQDAGGAYVAGFDGTDGWVTPSVEALGLPPRFVTLGNFYFVAMPFVFADPGVRSRDLGQTTLDGRTYDLVSIDYDQGVGDSADDDYVLYFDAATHRLHLIHFAVTYTAVRGQTPVDQVPRTVLVFDDWQRVGGLLVPARASFHGWVDGAPDGEGASFIVRDVAFGQDPPDDATFSPPADAVIDHSNVAP